MNLLWALACIPRDLPPALQVEPDGAVVTTAPPENLAAAMDWLVGADPLVRRPPALSIEVAEGLDPHLAAWARLVVDPPSEPSGLLELERGHSGTLAVPLARGWRLGEVERDVAGLLDGDSLAERRALIWLAPLREPRVTRPPTRSPWSWLPAVDRDSILAYGEGHVLRGWLDGPAIPVASVQRALQGPTVDRLAVRPEGRILLARDDSETEPPGLERLSAAVELWLLDAAADRNSEQERVREAMAALGVEQPGDALAAEARAVMEALIPHASNDASAGGALLAWQIVRWRQRCDDCGGLDRTQTLTRTANWDDALAPLAATARLAALKQAVDAVEEALRHDAFEVATADLVDALSGTGAGPLELNMLEQRSADAATWLTLTRALGAPDGTRPEEGLAALQAWLAATAGRTLEYPLSDTAAEAAARIQRRAAP